MPELAEVEWYRKEWDPGLGEKIVAVEFHAAKRVFRETDTHQIRQCLVGQDFVHSVARGKRMLFRFAKNHWLGIHLGMTGSLRTEPARFAPTKHDHLVLWQSTRALVFRDARQFGRIRFHRGSDAPDWWRSDVPEISEGRFNSVFLGNFLERHRKAPIKAVLLLQNGFSGIGNWMADEILWRAGIRPARLTGKLTARERASLLRETKFVAKQSLAKVGLDDSDLPRGWLIHQRWSKGGVCPKHNTLLRRATIGGRTTAWCPKCQR